MVEYHFYTTLAPLQFLMSVSQLLWFTVLSIVSLLVYRYVACQCLSFFTFRLTCIILPFLSLPVNAIRCIKFVQVAPPKTSYVKLPKILHCTIHNTRSYLLPPLQYFSLVLKRTLVLDSERNDSFKKCE